MLTAVAQVFLRTVRSCRAFPGSKTVLKQRLRLDVKSSVGQAKPVNLEGVMNLSKDVREFIVSNFLFGDGANLQDDTSLLDSGTVDSTGVLELIMFLEEKYNLKIDPDEVIPDNLDSINRIVRFLTEKLTAVA